RQLLIDGKKAWKAGKTAEACDAFKQAWSAYHHYQIAGALGECDFQSKHYRDAAEHLAYAMLEPAGQAPSGERERPEKLLKDAEAKVVALRIQVEPIGAEVLVNGRVVGKAPINGVVYAEAGSVLVEAKQDGYESHSDKVEAAEGASRDVAIHLRQA